MKNTTSSKKKSITDIVIPEKKYAEYGTKYVCIPISVEKKPMVQWRNLKETPKRKFGDDDNIALITGAINSITVVDIDIPKPNKDELDGMKKFEELIDEYNNGKALKTPTCISQSNGLHLYFEYDDDIKTTTGVNGYSIDIRNDNALIIAPPSVGLKGSYTWKNNISLHNTKLLKMPLWLKDWIKPKPKSEEKKKGKGKDKKLINNEIHSNNKRYVFIYNNLDIIDLLNKLPKKYCDVRDDWFIITSCLKSENLKDIWDTWSRQSNNYDLDENNEQWDMLVPKLDINYLMTIAIKEELDVPYNIIKKTKRINFLNTESDKIINEKHLEQDCLVNINERTIICKSNCGTGKTTFATKWIKTMCVDTGYKTMSLTVRVSLSYQQKTNFEKNNFDISHYKELDITELNSQTNLIIQIDSITKLDIAKWYNTVIYLDEISCLLSYIMAANTLTDRRVTVFNNLFMLLKQASYIICTDADVDDMVIEYFKKIGLKYYLLENQYINDVKTKAFEYNDKEILIQKMEEELLKNNKIVGCFDSKTELEIVVERLKKFCEKNNLTKQLNNFMIFSSSEGSDEDIIHLNDRHKMKNIFITPRIVIGVSIDNVIPRNVFLIGLCVSINCKGFFQQVSRCRNIKELHYYIAKRYRPLKYDSIEDVKLHYQNLLQNYNKLQIDSNKCKTSNDTILYHERSDHEKLTEIVNNGYASLDFTTQKWNMHETVFNELFYIHEYHDDIMRSAPKEQFKWLIESKGFIVTTIADVMNDVDKNIVSKEIRIVKKNVKALSVDMRKRALYNKENSLTSNEQTIMEDAKRRSEFLGIDFSKKVQKKKWEEFLIDDIKFTQHYAFRLIHDNIIKVNNNINKQNENNYNVLNIKTLMTKIKLIKDLEVVLNVKPLDIDTAREVDRFYEDILLNENTKVMIKNTFRINKQEDKMINKFEAWYYILIQMYRNVVGNNIINYKRNRKNNCDRYDYSMNQNVIDQHILLIKQYNDYKNNLTNNTNPRKRIVIKNIK